MDQPPPPATRPPRRPRPRGQFLRGAGLMLAVAASIAALWLNLAGNLAGARAAVYPHPQVAIDISSPNGQIQANTSLLFTARALSGHDLTYQWSFGDGPSISGPSVHYAYANYGHYQVQLIATDPTGQTASASRDLNLYPIFPVASFQWTADPRAALLVDFSAEASSGYNLTYTWDFGDGSITQAGSDVQHPYQQPGTYKVTLTVADPYGQRATASRSVTLHAPTAQISASITPVAGSARTYLFTTTDAGDQVQFQWYFGDGTSDNGASVRHTYLQSGTYTVVLTATTAASGNTVFQQDLTVP